MVKRIQLLIVTALCFWLSQLSAQQKFPVTANVVLNPPYSPYLSDFIAPGSNNLKYTFVFNDFKEPSWQVKLRIKVESIDLKLETKPEYLPAPITLTPGVSVSLSGSELTDYFDFKNLNILGPAAAADSERAAPECGHRFKNAVLAAPVEIVWNRGRESLQSRKGRGRRNVIDRND